MDGVLCLFGGRVFSQLKDVDLFIRHVRFFYTAELMEIVKNCQLVAAKAGCKSMNTYVKISYKPEGEVLTIEKKVTKHH